MPTTSLEPIAVTCGDPSGIGIEVTVGAWEVLRDAFPFFLICDPAHLPETAPAVIIERPGKAASSMADGLPVLPHAFPCEAVAGRPVSDNARAVVEVIERGVRLVQSGQASALCTAPISKKELLDHAAFSFPGHTEYLASLTDAELPVMMIASDELRVVPVTIHMPLAAVPKALTGDLIRQTILITHDAMVRDFGMSAPRIAVAGLNPHAGENGMLGAEDAQIIRPVCEDLRGLGLNVTDPLPADTMFHAAARAGYDVAICMYHDQALVPAKTLAFDTGVNVTLGLPIIRTSPDHGTAFNIAGKGQANPSSMVEALRLARSMAESRAA